MRGIFGIVGLLLVVAIVGILAKKQLSAGVAPPPPAALAGTGVSAPTGTPQQQVQQFKQAAEAAVQQARPMPTDDK